VAASCLRPTRRRRRSSALCQVLEIATPRRKSSRSPAAARSPRGRALSPAPVALGAPSGAPVPVGSAGRAVAQQLLTPLNRPVPARVRLPCPFQCCASAPRSPPAAKVIARPRGAPAKYGLVIRQSIRGDRCFGGARAVEFAIGHFAAGMLGRLRSRFGVGGARRSDARPGAKPPAAAFRAVRRRRRKPALPGAERAPGWGVFSRAFKTYSTALGSACPRSCNRRTSRS
jgi:hypothetical protein